MTTILIPAVLRVGEESLHHVGYEDTWVARFALNGGTSTFSAVIATISEVGDGCFIAKPKASNLKNFFFREEAFQNLSLSRVAKGDPVLLLGLEAGHPRNRARFAWRLETENRQRPEGRQQGVIVAKEGGLGVIKSYEDEAIGYRLTGKTASIGVGTLVSFTKCLDRSGHHFAEDIRVE